MNLMRVIAGTGARIDAGGRAPKAAGTVDMAAIRYVENFAPIARPHRIDFVIVGAVVIARQCALVLAGQTLDVAQCAVREVAREQVKTAIEQRGDEYDAFAIRRKTRFDIHGAVTGERARRATLQVQHPQLQCFAGIGRVDDPASVGRPIWLIVITDTPRELFREGGAEALAPQGAAHRVDQFFRVRRPRQAGRPGGQLREVHFPKIIRVRQIDLAEHGQALGQR
jgi:hypothetical protein